MGHNTVLNFMVAVAFILFTMLLITSIKPVYESEQTAYEAVVNETESLDIKERSPDRHYGEKGVTYGENDKEVYVHPGDAATENPYHNENEYINKD